MMFGYGGGLGGVVAWLWMIGLAILVVVFIVLLVRGLGGHGGGEARAILRGRLARGEIAPDEYERLRAVLGASAQPWGGRWRPAVIAAVLLAALLILGGLFGGAGYTGPNAPWGGMMGPGMMPG